MATTYKVLGQVSIVAATDTTLYTVPASTSTVVSSITVCNQSSAARTYRIAVRPAGAAIAVQHYLAFDVSLAPNDSQIITMGITLAATDVVTVRANQTTVSFSLFGSELT